MSEKSLLDTDILSEILRGKNPDVVRQAAAYRQQFGVYSLSTITVLEMVKGFTKAGREDRVVALLEALGKEELIALDESSAVLAGRIYGQLEKHGLPIGRADPMIAGIALAKGLVLVTGNVEHFQRIATLGFPLRLANWRDHAKAD
jgi:tRNA(fMet)-specific endonuclease VapC